MLSRTKTKKKDFKSVRIIEKTDNKRVSPAITIEEIVFHFLNEKIIKWQSFSIKDQTLNKS